MKDTAMWNYADMQYTDPISDMYLPYTGKHTLY
jgi:hypothetical protein